MIVKIKYIVCFIVLILAYAKFIGLRTNDNIDEFVEQKELGESCDKCLNYRDSATANSSFNMLRPTSLVNIPEKEFYRIAYITSYNSSTRNPNWVAWHLTREHTDGMYSRKGVPYYDDCGMAIGIASFSPEIVRGSYFVDMEAPAPRQEHSDWREHPADIDHGHLCPAADCKWDKGAMNQSFLLTNMCPQNHGLNGGDWDKLENKCRSWAKRFGDVYIVAGPIFYDGVKTTFGDNEIAIPDAFFKVVLCLNGTPKALGFVFPNEDAKHDLNYYVVTVDEVEEITGLDFFSSLDDEVENDVESKSDLSMWK